MRVISIIFLIFLILLGVTFAVLNAGAVTLNYYVGVKQISLSILLVFSIILGVFFGFLAMLFPLIRLKKENFQLRHQVKIIEKEVENLRSIPIQSKH